VEHWPQAEENLQKALQLEPDFGVAWARLATIAERLGHQDLEHLALSHSEKNSRFHDLPDPWTDELLDDCYDTYKLRVAAAMEQSARRSDAAIHLLERALRIAPDDALAHRELGRLLLFQRDFEGSRSHLEKAVALAPEDSENWISLGVMADAVGDTREATRATLAGLSHNPSSPGLHLQRGRQLMALGQPAEALAEFSEARRLRPNEAEALVEIALVHLRAGNLDQAVAQLEAALRVEQDYPMALIALARINIEKSDQADARILITRARRQNRVPRRDLDDLSAAFRQKFNIDP
jgi:Tfp pilus assembly protein PilF